MGIEEEVYDRTFLRLIKVSDISEMIIHISPNYSKISLHWTSKTTGKRYAIYKLKKKFVFEYLIKFSSIVKLRHVDVFFVNDKMDLKHKAYFLVPEEVENSMPPTVMNIL